MLYKRVLQFFSRYPYVNHIAIQDNLKVISHIEHCSSQEDFKKNNMSKCLLISDTYYSKRSWINKFEFSLSDRRLLSLKLWLFVGKWVLEEDFKRLSSVYSYVKFRPPHNNGSKDIDLIWMKNDNDKFWQTWI